MTRTERKKQGDRAISRFIELLNGEPGFFHYPMTNEEWGKVTERLRRQAALDVSVPEDLTRN